MMQSCETAVDARLAGPVVIARLPRGRQVLKSKGIYCLDNLASSPAIESIIREG